VIPHWEQQKKQPLVELENGGNKKGESVMHEEYNIIGSFTQLLIAPTCDYDNLFDGSLF
jgi:hypothetical protein